MTIELCVDRCDACQSGYRSYPNSLFEVLSGFNPRFTEPGPGIPLRPAVLLVERCDDCDGQGITPRDHGGVGWATEERAPCPSCDGRGHTGRVVARRVEHVFGFGRPSPQWSIAVSGPVTNTQGIYQDNLPALLAWVANKRPTEVAWRGLALVDDALYVVGAALVSELPEGAMWLTGNSKSWCDKQVESGLDPLSRALGLHLKEMLP